MNRRSPIPVCGKQIVTAGVLALSLSFAVGTADSAANPAPDKRQPAQSSYSNTNDRPDPLLPVRLKGARGAEPRLTVNQSDLRLQGIIWHSSKPAAVVNRQRIGLNETVTIRLTSGDHAVKAIVIDRDRVVLKVDDRRVELQLER